MAGVGGGGETDRAVFNFAVDFDFDFAGGKGFVNVKDEEEEEDVRELWVSVGIAEFAVRGSGFVNVKDEEDDVRDRSLFFAAGGGEERVKSTSSTSSKAETVFRNRGDVRRFTGAFDAGLEFDVEDVEEKDEFEDMDWRGGRVGLGWREVVCVVGIAGFVLVRIGAFAGEDIVKSSSSIVSFEVWNLGGAGIGAVLAGSVFGFVGVPDGEEKAQVSIVVCLVFAGDAVTDFVRVERDIGTSFVVWIFAFFVGRGDGEKSAGELTRFTVSMVSAGGGVDGRFRGDPMSAGSVRER